MFFSSSKLACASTLLLKLASAGPSLRPRATEATAYTLYAYSTDINGLPIFFGDGLAYIGSLHETPDFLDVAANITFNTYGQDTTTPWTINSSTLNGTREFYINVADGAYDEAGFLDVSNNASLPSGAVDVGFTFYGTQVFYATTSGDWEAQFWVNETSTVGYWELLWNTEGIESPNTHPVTIKTTAPTVEKK